MHVVFAAFLLKYALPIVLGTLLEVTTIVNRTNCSLIAFIPFVGHKNKKKAQKNHKQYVFQIQEKLALFFTITNQN